MTNKEFQQEVKDLMEHRTALETIRDDFNTSIAGLVEVIETLTDRLDNHLASIQLGGKQ